MSILLDIKYEKYKLENGLEVVLYPNYAFPTVSLNLWYKVGSANEKPNKTGFAHLFEHMMFQGSLNVNKEEHFKFIQEAGGTLNGSTSMDRTNYYETVPPDSLELVLWLESDRMGYLLPALTKEKLQNQKEVVMNERRQNYDNQPYGLAWEIIFSNLYPKNHPYHWPTIGWMKDIEKFEMDDVEKFFKKFYSPNNASLVIGGNFEPKKAIKLVDKYFGEIRDGIQVDELRLEREELKKSIFITHQDNVNLTKIYYAWHSDKGYGEDDSALDILADILSGSKSSRLNKELVHEKQLLLDVSSFQYSAKYAGAFFIVFTLKPDVEIDLIHENLIRIISEIVKDGIKLEELERSLNSYKSSFIYSLQNIENLANQINNYNCYLNEPNSFLYDLNRYENIDIRKIQNTASKYLTKSFLRLVISPKPNHL